MHTISTQYAHTQKQNNMQHTEQNTEQKTENNNTEQDSTQHSTHNYRTYSLDYYNEYAYIKNNDTIELYTILQDKI